MVIDDWQMVSKHQISEGMLSLEIYNVLLHTTEVMRTTWMYSLTIHVIALEVNWAILTKDKRYMESVLALVKYFDTAVYTLFENASEYTLHIRQPSASATAWAVRRYLDMAGVVSPPLMERCQIADNKLRS